MSELPAHLLRGQQTREKLMEHAVQIATREGLEALTIGRVAETAGLAKASVLGHYGSKEQLQLATLEAGSRRFIAQVIAPSSQRAEGIVRLKSLLDGWLEHIRRADGGCLFASVAAEFDGRPGAVRDGVQKLLKVWLAVLATEVARAKQLKQLSSGTDPEQLVFCLHGIELSLNVRLQLFQERSALARAESAMHGLLHDAATPLGRRLLSAHEQGAR